MATQHDKIMEELHGISLKIVRLEKDIESLPEVVAKFEKFVTIERFRPTEMIAFGLVAGVLVSVLTALLLQVIPNPIPTQAPTEIVQQR